MFQFKQLSIRLAFAALFSIGSAAHAATQPIYTQNFDNVTLGANPTDLIVLNRSTTPVDQWGGGNSGPDFFPAQSGAPGSYFSDSFESGGQTGSISDWLLTPVRTLTSNMTYSFWVRGADGGTFADSLQFSVCTGAVCTAITAASTTSNAVLASLFAPARVNINPTFDAAGFPTIWTQYSGTITGLANVNGRFAFRYVVDDVAIHGNYIGLDTIAISAIPEPESILLMGLGLAAMGLSLRRKAGQ